MKKLSGLARLSAALRWSLHGFRAAYREEAAFRQEVWLVLALLPVACLVNVSPGERALLILTLLLPLLIELLNTAVEAVTDLVTAGKQLARAKKAKDTASAAVLLSLVVGAAVWLIILLPKWL